MSETDRVKHPQFAFCCHLTPSTYAVWQNPPELAKSDLSAFTADSLDQENKMQCIRATDVSSQEELPGPRLQEDGSFAHRAGAGLSDRSSAQY